MAPGKNRSFDFDDVIHNICGTSPFALPIRFMEARLIVAVFVFFGVISTPRAADSSAVLNKNAPGHQDVAVPLAWGDGTKILVVGGGTSHDFQKWFNEADVATLRAAGKCSVNYTESSATATKALAEADVLVSSTNQKGFDTPAFRAALMKFADSGKGIVLLHPAVWYNWPWPEYNEQLVGGGARGHESVGKYSVDVVAQHQVTRGLPANFQVTDELYHMTVDPKGAPIEILAKASTARGVNYPSIWLVSHPRARIVAIALGNDGRVHELPEYKKLLANAVAWAAGGSAAKAR